MAFKNIFSSTYAIVENVNYNGPSKDLSFDLVLYSDSSKGDETGRMSYRVHGKLTTYEVDSVITSIPAGLDHEAMPDDFDFDAFDDFKSYLIGNSPTENLFKEKTGFMYMCEFPPAADDDGNWPSQLTDEHEKLANPDYDATIPKTITVDGEVVTNPDYVDEQFVRGEQIKIALPISYEWGPLNKDVNFAIKDKSGNYWKVSGTLGTSSATVTQVDKPFLDDDWATWFSASAMDVKDKNLQKRIYAWLKTKPEYEDALDV